MARSKSSERWLKEHFADEFVKQARAKHFRSRAVFKLSEIDDRENLFSPGMTVVDLGAAPGGWSQYAAQKVCPSGKVVALDLLPVEPIEGVDFLQGDFREQAVFDRLLDVLGGGKANLILSDMAPNTSGVKEIDQPKSMYLAELALEMARGSLVSGGSLLVKVFQGTGFDQFHRELKGQFDKVLVRKPKASRQRSPEIYFLGKDFKSA